MGLGRTTKAAALLAACAACEQQHAPPSAPSAAAADHEAPAAHAASEPNASQPVAYVYSAVGRRDPFRSYLSDLREREQAERAASPHAETENFDTTQYRLTAIVSGTQEPSAMVEDPTGKGHILRIGHRIGKHMGRVTNIDATGLSLVETFYDGTGKALEVPSAMRLPQTDDIAAPSP